MRGLDSFPSLFRKYNEDTTPSVTDFQKLAEQTIQRLIETANAQQASSGGYIVFLDYSSQSTRFFLVSMIKSKPGIRLSRDLKPEELEQLDFSRIHQAARINLAKLSIYENANEEEKRELNYLSFVSPTATQSAAGYFIDALGCKQGTASATATSMVIKESKAFFREQDELKKHRLDFEDDLKAYLYGCANSKSSAKLSQVESLARKYFPAHDQDVADEYADLFIQRLNSDRIGVPNEFPVHKTTLKRRFSITLKTNDIEMTFDRSALGDTPDAAIYYDKANSKIVLSTIPDDTKLMIEDHLGREGS